MDIRRIVTAGAVAALAAGAAWGQEAGGGTRAMPAGYVFNIVDWDSADLPRIYERSAQLPMQLDEVRQLSAAKFTDAAIVKMLEERRCACDASVGALVDLKKAGVSEAVIQAVSLHSLAPNRAVDLVIHVDFEGLGGAGEASSQSRKAYLYLILPDGERDRVFFGNLGEVLDRPGAAAVDNTDLLLPKQVRRVTFAAKVPLKEHGDKRALVFTSTRPDIYTAADIPEADRRQAMEFAFDYPASSPQQRCSLQVLHRQDAMLADRWHLERSHFECEWE